MNQLGGPRWFQFRNADTEEVPAFGVMEITDAVTRGGKTCYVVQKPSVNFQRLYLINGPARVPPGEDYSGNGTFSLVYALCDSGATPAYGESWGVKPDEWALFQHRPGFFMLGNVQGEGAAQRALVRQQEVQQLRGVLAGVMSQGGSATMNIYFRDGAAWTNSTMTQMVYDDLLAAAGSLAASTVVIARFYCDRWWVQEARCA